MIAMEAITHILHESEYHYIVRKDPPRCAGLPLDALVAAKAILLIAMAMNKASLYLCIGVSMMLGTALWWSLTTITQESITVLHGVGVVLQTHRRLARSTSVYIELDKVRAVIINEGLTSTDVQYYLAFIILGSDTMAVAFPNLLPPLRIIQPIYREVHALLAGQPRPACVDGPSTSQPQAAR